MKKYLIFGSCRIKEPYVDDPDAILSPLGHTHTTADTVQALEFMTGIKSFPDELKDYYRGWGYRDEKQVDLSQFATVIIEIGSIKNYRYQDFIIHTGYPDQIKLNEVKELDNVQLTKEDEPTMIHNLDRIKAICQTNKLMLVTQQNIDFLPARYFIAYVVSTWCRQNNVVFLDPTPYIYKPRADEVFLTVGGKLDPYHYQPKIFSKIKELVRQYDSL